MPIVRSAPPQVRGGFLLALLLCASLRGADCNLNGIDDAEDLATGASADCNEDGRPDECEAPLIRADLGEQFGSGGEIPRGVFLEDFSGDGVPDVALGTPAGVSVWLSPAEGPGEATRRVFTRSDVALGSWRHGELNSDGRTDLIAVESGSEPPRVALFANDGEARFTKLGSVEFEATIFWLLFTDLSGDGRDDILATHRGAGTVAVALSEADGTFARPVIYTVGAFPGVADTEDLDGDGNVDAIVVNRNTGDVSVLFGEGSGRFAEARSLPLGVDFPERLTVVDLEDDGRPDIVTLDARGVVILRNRDGRTFNDPQRLLLEQPRLPGVVQTGDLDADGDVDLVATSPREVGLQIFWNVAGSFATTGFVDAEITPPAMLMTDADGDGDLDWLVANREEPGAHFLWNLEGERREGISFRAPVDYPANGEPHGFEMADLDADGDTDVITANNEPGAGLSTLLNRGDGTLADGVAHIQGGEVFSVAPGDFDADGDRDIVAADTTGQDVQLVWNSGNATYDSSTPARVAGKPWFVAAANLDDMGGDDVITAVRGSGIVSILRNFSGDRFTSEEHVTVPGGPTAVVPVDLDGDGRLDIAVSSVGAARVTVLLNRGSAADGTLSFGEERLSALSTAPNFLTTADFDGDGHSDLAVTSAVNTEVTALWNRGDATFDASAPLATGISLAMSLTAGDLDGDGLPEIVTAHPAIDTIGLLLNTSGREFRVAGRRATGDGRGPRFVGATDLDARGELDLVTANHDSFSVTVFLNDRQDLGGSGFLSRLCTAEDFQKISVGSSSSVFERETLFLVPARDDPQLIAPLFQDMERFALQPNFLRDAFPEMFGALSAEEYLQLVGRRATRSYYAGRLQRLERGGRLVFAFSVLADTERDPSEAPRLEEVSAVHALLSAAAPFASAPLSYRPEGADGRREAETWVDPGFPLLLEEPDGGPPPAERPTFTLDIPVGTTVCGVFSKERVNRPLRTEYDLKSTVVFKSGQISLPTTAESFRETLFEEVRVGTRETIATPEGEGLFRLVVIPSGADETVYRFTYEQGFQLPGGEQFDLRLLNLDFRSTNASPMTEPLVLDARFLTFSLILEGSIGGAPRIRYASCNYDLLPHWEVKAEATDGTTIELMERFEPSENLLDTGPAALVEAMVTMADGPLEPTRDYWRLVYAAARHNRDVRYWIELEPRLTLPGLEAGVRFLELQAPEAETMTEPALRYLGPDFEPLAEFEVTSFSKRRLAAGAGFRRGDLEANGGIDVADPIRLVQYLFVDGPAPSCLSSGDFNDDGTLNLVDVIRLVGYLFRTGAPAPAPFEECGVDPTTDALGCDSFPPCG